MLVSVWVVYEVGVRREESSRLAHAVEYIAERRRSMHDIIKVYRRSSFFFIIFYKVIPPHIAPSRSC